MAGIGWMFNEGICPSMPRETTYSLVQTTMIERTF